MATPPSPAASSFFGSPTNVPLVNSSQPRPYKLNSLHLGPILFSRLFLVTDATALPKTTSLLSTVFSFICPSPPNRRAANDVSNNNGIQNNNKPIASKSNEAKSKEETWEDM
eukprot:jgi/Psemu1/19181/gm1.19181_g